jgi:TldD protein
MFFSVKNKTTPLAEPLFRGVSQACSMDDLNDAEVLRRMLNAALERGGDFAEVCIERRVSTWITLTEDKISGVQSGIKQGAGIRVIQGQQTGYAFSDDLDLTKIAKAARMASSIARNKNGASAPIPHLLENRNVSVGRATGETGMSKKAELVRRANAAARDHDQRIQEVSCTYTDERKEMIIANSEGLWTQDAQSLFSLHVSTLAASGSERSNGTASCGGRFEFSYFDAHSPESAGLAASAQAIRKLGAREAPAGTQTVVIHKGWGGILIHEAVGHGLEGDFNRRGHSVYSGRLGEKVASELVTIVDDGTFPHGRGSFRIDDEGTPAQRNTLIEKGILKSYMFDKLNASLTNTKSSGNGRREDFTHAPLPRMTNTFMEAGTSDAAEILRSVNQGIYAKALGDGQVDMASGNFVFEIQEGYLIEDGKITYPITGANLIGNGPDIMTKVVAVGNDLEIETGMGLCGKAGQTLPISVGQPTIRIDAMTVGGTRMS